MCHSSDHRPVVARFRISLSEKEQMKGLWSNNFTSRANFGSSLFHAVLISSLEGVLHDSKLRKCRNDHPLENEVAKRFSKCELCGREVHKGTTLFRCERCNFCICQGCSSLKGTIMVSMRSSDRLCIHKMKVRALHENGTMMHFHDSGYEVDHKLPVDIEWVEVTFSVMGGSRVYAVDRLAPGRPWVKGIAGDHKRECFKYEKPPAGFGVRFTMKGTALHSYVSEEEFFDASM
eukprot:gnl/MRDRNA2_/MRDRNA2_68909_c0_seq1.p1 gnl/MRDRNA2_/MRDRNA2_68909_c0~~gnl/MRDRNA2_/MRDRNA2_68909_c0_seq1.p1  ORF type:complete len:251 (+),score=30.07 gnl/MRDRNA2_/MRDRNA2_68909_c0_seq1:56-754(+)